MSISDFVREERGRMCKPGYKVGRGVYLWRGRAAGELWHNVRGVAYLCGLLLEVVPGVGYDYNNGGELVRLSRRA